MKPTYALLLLLVMGCGTSNTSKTEVNETDTKIDSIINQSKQNLVILDQASRKSDSSITKKVEKTVKQITTLKEEVKTLKEENNELKIKLDDATDGSKPFQLLPVSSGKNDR